MEDAFPDLSPRSWVWLYGLKMTLAHLSTHASLGQRRTQEQRPIKDAQSNSAWQLPSCRSQPGLVWIRDDERDDENAPLVNGRHQADLRRGDPGSPGQQLEGQPLPPVHWWEDSPAGEAARRKKQKEIQRWLNGIPWGSYFNAPTIAAASGLTVG